MRSKSPARAAAALAVAGLLLSACWEEDEQGRVLRYQKGTYLGAPDTELTEEQREELRARARGQAGL